MPLDGTFALPCERCLAVRLPDGGHAFNGMTAYHVACSNVAMLYAKHGSSWPKYFIPVKTFGNAMAFAGQFAGTCVKWVKGLPFLPDMTRERIAEIWFGWIKRHCRGTPREKDTIYGHLSEVMESIPKY